MGTTFASYVLDKASKQVMPQEIISSNEEINEDLAPQSWWQYEILEATGKAKFLEIIEDVKAMCL